MLVGLLASTGLRSGETLRLDRADVDLVKGVLQMRRTKFRKDRLSPFISRRVTRCVHMLRLVTLLFLSRKDQRSSSASAEIGSLRRRYFKHSMALARLQTLIRVRIGD